MSIYKIYLFFFLFVFTSCGTKNNPNENIKGEDILNSHETKQSVETNSMAYSENIYVPIYSDLYISRTTPKSLLAATLSIRNTSFQDTLYVTNIDYFNTEGAKVKEFINKTIAIYPMATINYVIEKEDDSGGPGANFILGLHARNSKIKPVIQAVMVGLDGNKSFSFLTNGISI